MLLAKLYENSNEKEYVPQKSLDSKLKLGHNQQ